MRYMSEYNVFFVHTPKNGGQSIRNAMARIPPLDFGPLAADPQVSAFEADQASESGFMHATLAQRPKAPGGAACWER